MRVLAFAVGALGLAHFAVGGVVLSKSTSTYAPPSGPNLTRTNPPMPTRSIHTAPHVDERAESSPTVTTFTPTCSAGYSYGPTTLTSWGGCNEWGHSCTVPVSSSTTSDCVQTMCSSGSTPYLPIWTETSCTEMTTKPKDPVTTSCTGKPTTGTLTCWYTSPNWGGTRRNVGHFAARTTQDTGGRSQRAVARFAEPTTTPSTTVCPSGEAPRPPTYLTSSCSWKNIGYTIYDCSTSTVTYTDGVTCTKTPEPDTRTTDWGGRRTRWLAEIAAPTAARSTIDWGGRRSQRLPEADQADVADPPFPTCSFDLDKGQYICPEAAPKTLPICSFNLSKGQYDCPPPVGGVVAEATTLKTVEKKE